MVQRSAELTQVYGNVYAFNFGEHAAVVINDYKTLKEAFQRSECTGRPKLEAFLFIHDNQLRGIGTQDGEPWKQLRRFIVKQMREYGKKSIESIISEETLQLIQHLDHHSKEPVSTKGFFNPSSVNVLWRIITGEPVASERNEVIMAVVNLAGGSIKVVIAALFADLAKRFPNISGYNNCVKSHKLLSDYIRNFILIRKRS
ncbi:unnamed protein product, partial [Allacma fusca]